MGIVEACNSKTNVIETKKGKSDKKSKHKSLSQKAFQTDSYLNNDSLENVNQSSTAPHSYSSEKSLRNTKKQSKRSIKERFFSIKFRPTNRSSKRLTNSKQKDSEITDLYSLTDLSHCYFQILSTYLFFEDLRALSLTNHHMRDQITSTTTLEEIHFQQAPFLYLLDPQTSSAQETLHIFHLYSHTHQTIPLKTPLPQGYNTFLLSQKLFLSGGEHPSCFQPTPNLLRFSFTKNKFLHKASMLIPRINHNLTGFTFSQCQSVGNGIGNDGNAGGCLKESLFVIGGENGEKLQIPETERYFVKEDRWQSMPSLNQSRSKSCACVFQNRFLYVFGGVGRDYRQVSTVEKYDLFLSEKGWVMVLNAAMREALGKRSRAAALQISPHAVMLFGGNPAYDDYFIFHPGKNKVKKGKGRLCARENFFQRQPVLFDKSVFCIGNSQNGIHKYSLSQCCWKLMECNEWVYFK